MVRAWCTNAPGRASGGYALGFEGRTAETAASKAIFSPAKTALFAGGLF